MRIFLLLACIAVMAPARAFARGYGPSLEISPDGKYFAASFDGNLNIGTINGTDKKFVKTVAFGHYDWGFLGFTPDGKKLGITLLKKDEVQYYSTGGKFLGRISDAGPGAMSRSFKWFYDNRLENGRRKNRLCVLGREGCVPKYNLPEDLDSAAFSPGDKMAAISVYRPGKKERKGESSLTLMSLKTGKALKRHVPKEFGRITHPVFSADGRFMAFSDGDSKVRVVSLSDWKFMTPVFRPGDYAADIEFSRKGDMLAVAYTSALRVYSVPDMRLLLKRDFTGSKDTDWSFYDLAFASDGSFVSVLVSSSPKGKNAFSVKFIDIKK